MPQISVINPSTASPGSSLPPLTTICLCQLPCLVYLFLHLLYLTCLHPTASASHPPYVMSHINASFTRRGRFVWMHTTFADSRARAGSRRLLALRRSLPVVAQAQPPKIVLPLNDMVLITLSLFVYYACVL